MDRTITIYDEAGPFPTMTPEMLKEAWDDINVQTEWLGISHFIEMFEDVLTQEEIGKLKQIGIDE